uniref:Ankyrin repeat and EF-hand domain containing 1a n=1 Tax=Seriola lalandi dorsalis TaxID=1841481 RepID=A0A3B4X162_SERLL
MSLNVKGRLQVLQIYRLLQWVHEGDKEQIEKMVNLGVENLINLAEPQDGTGVLHVAVSANNRDLVSFLLSHGAQPNIQDKKGRTPIMLAAELGNDTILALLAQSHADLRLEDAEGKGVLFYCMYPTKRHTRCLQLALRCQADVNNMSAQGTHVFQLMCEKASECTPMCLIMLDSGTDPNATNQKTGITALMEAAKAGSVQLVRAILKAGGHPNSLDWKRFTAVHYALLIHRTSLLYDYQCREYFRLQTLICFPLLFCAFQVIQVLSAYSADMGVINLEDCTPLHYAAATGNANCCKFLAQRGCNPKLKNQEGSLPRQIAKDAGHKAAAKELRKAEKQQGKGNKSSGVGLMSDFWALTLHDWSNEYETELRQEIGDKSDTVTSEMFISVLEELKAPVEPEQLQTVILAHDKGKDGCVNISDFIKGVKYIKKPFLLSSYMPKKKKEKGGKGGKKKKGKFELPMPICTLPPELMPRRSDGGPPNFMIETYYNCSDISRFDHDHPPEHPIMNDSGWYMEKPEKIYVNINYCVKSGDLESLDLAFNQGVPVDVQDELYKTPLMVACSSGNYKVAQYLLSQGADVNACDQFLWTPLHHAAHAGQVELIDLLVNAGADVDAQALSGGTPLMRAIESSRPSCVDFLIKAGANVNAENKKGLSVAFADSRIIDLVKDKMDSQPKPKEAGKGKGGKAQKTKSPATNKIKIVWLQIFLVFFPPTTSQLMSKIERRKEPLSLEVDFDDFMMPFSQNIQRTTLELAKTTD